MGTHNEDGALHFLIRNNPLADLASHPPHTCLWHAAVFETLFTEVIGKPYQCYEMSCRAMGAELCHFVVERA